MARIITWLKNWAVTCNGAYVINDEALIALEDAFC